MATTTSINDQISELTDESNKLEAEASDLLKQAQDKFAARNEKLKEIGNLYIQMSESSGDSLGQLNGATVEQPARAQRGKYATSRGAKNKAPKAKNARNTKNTTAKRGPKGNPNNKMSCRGACWHAVDRDPKEFKKIFPDYPPGAVGLKVSEVREIIESEKLWSSDGDAGAMIQQALYSLKEKEGKMGRNEDDRRYFIIKNATLDGPKLDANGNPVKNKNAKK